MQARLKLRAEDLIERLFIAALEMRRSRGIEQRLAAYQDFRHVIDQIDALRRDAEALRLAEKELLLDRLDRKVASVLRSPECRIAEWLGQEADNLTWTLGRLEEDLIQGGCRC